MGEIYYVMVAILALLAVSGLYVGVTNDAVNFLNSAIGSRAPHEPAEMISRTP